MNITNIEEDFKKYLELVYQHPEKIPFGQFMELKQAYFGCASQLLMKLKQDISPLSNEEGIITLMNLEEEVHNFWKQSLPKDK